MSKEFSFSVMPSVSISRSRFARKSQHKTSFNLGQIIPIYVDEVLPGDTRSFDMASLVRMSTPIAPIMDNIYLDIYAFFIPNRLVWDHWKDFMGENNESAGIPAVSYSVPYLGVIEGGSSYFSIGPGSLADYMGLPIGKIDVRYDKISALPFRAYYLVYNEWFRNQNVEAPFAIQTGDDNEVIISEVYNNDFCYYAAGEIPLSAYKLSDYFTKSLPYAQKGAAVTIPLSTGYLPVEVKANTGSGLAAETPLYLFSDPGDSIGAGEYGKLRTSVSSGGGGYGNLGVNIAQATAATINDLRYAFQLQKLLEKDALYGTRYWEILKAHFGVEAPDASLQRPEYLGGTRININIDQVLSTAGYANTGSTTVGAPGANSVSVQKGSLFTKSFVEHGTLLVLAVARQDHTYHQGINRMWTRQGRYDFYFPVFANLGAQSVLNKEIYAQGSVNDDQVFGYQEAWAEYRFKPSICTGQLRPTSGNLDFWTLGDNFGSLPTLGLVFLRENRDNISRALVTGSNGPDFIADFYFEDVAVRPMPTYSIPGLIDHH